MRRAQLPNEGFRLTAWTAGTLLVLALIALMVLKSLALALWP